MILLIAAASALVAAVPVTIGCLLARDIVRDVRAAAAYTPAHSGRGGLVVDVAPRLPRWQQPPRATAGRPPWDLPAYPDMHRQLATGVALLAYVQLLAAVPALRPGWAADTAREIGGDR